MAYLLGERLLPELKGVGSRPLPPAHVPSTPQRPNLVRAPINPRVYPKEMIIL